MSIIARICMLLIASVLTLGIVACKEEGPAEQAGKQIDEAAKDAGEAAEDAAKEAEDAADKAGDALKNLQN